MGDEKIVVDLTGKTIVDLEEWQMLTNLKNAVNNKEIDHVLVIEMLADGRKRFRYDSTLEMHKEIIKKCNTLELELAMSENASRMRILKTNLDDQSARVFELYDQNRRYASEIAKLKEEITSLKSKLNFVNLCLPFLKRK